MSSDKNPEVVGCDASIMKNVWEIREREASLRNQQEEERLSKSALKAINEDWASRLAARQGGYKRVERKPRTMAESTGEDSSAPKTRCPPPTPGVAAPAPTPRATPQRPAPAQARGKKVQQTGVGKAQLLTSLSHTQPSPMVWGKSWKFSKDLPLQEENTDPPNWGQCWMFATQQPFTEAGKPWPNGPCKMDPTMLHLWDKPVFRVPEEDPLSWAVCSDEWDGSWKNANKANKESVSELGIPKYGFFTTLVESHRHNNDLYSSEWSDCWKSTKPRDNEGSSFQEAIAMKPEKGDEQSSEWVECWKLCNHHGLTIAQEVHQQHSSEWSYSWSVAMPVQNNHNSEVSAKDGKSQRKDKEFMFADRNKAHFLLSELDNEFKAISEWGKSWQVTKNDTKPTPEIEKTLKTEPPKMEQSMKVQERPASSASDQDFKFLQLKHSVLFCPRREVTHSMLLQLKHLEKNSTCPEWKESWKMLKHQLRTSQRQRRVQLKPFDEEREKEWKDSWKFTNPSLGQNPEMWQQEWTTTPQIRINRAQEHNHFPAIELPKNGPTGERTWNESWRMSRHQLEASQRRTPTSPTTFWQPQRQLMRSPGDWREAWRVSETQHRHDYPSYTQWVEAWRSSAFQSGSYQSNQWQRGMRWVSKALEIQAKKEKMSFQRAEKMFQEGCLDKVWADSWKAGPIFAKCSTGGGSNLQTKMGGSSEYGSKWGMSFRLANPMPKMDQPWVKSSPNLSYYAVMWSKQHNDHKYYININFTANSRVYKLWSGSQQFLQSFSAKLVSKAKPAGQSADPRVILTKTTKLRKQLYINLERKDKQPDKKYAGCHLLGKTQPKPKRGGAASKVKLEEDSGEDKFEEMWAESWRFLVRPGSLRNKVKSLRGWEEAWKMLLPLYLTQNGPRAK